MKKNLLTILIAGLLLLTVTACKKDPDKNNDDTNDTGDTTGSFMVVETGTGTETETKGDPSEENPTFVPSNVTEIVIVSNAANIRSATDINDETNIVASPSEGTTYTITGESENWYSITYKDQTCYIAKTVAADAALLSTFTAIEGGEDVEVINGPVFIRSYPSADYDYAKRNVLETGTKLTRVAVGETWSQIKFEVTSETETNADGSAVTEVKYYYINSKYLQAVEADTEATTQAVTEEVTTAAAAE